MMRSLYSGVAGLRVHQNKMDVIGNNIANVNTVGYKAQTVTFTDVFYQTVQAASGPNVETGKGGTNAKQIGIGAALGTIATNITKQGGMQATDNSFDCMINGEEFFIVSDGQNNYFTKAGNFNVDEAGYLVNGSGLTVMGWQVNDDGDVVKDRVSALRVMTSDKMSAAPERTEDVCVIGNLNQSDASFASSSQRDQYVPFTIQFYDSQGYLYSALYHVRKVASATPQVADYSYQMCLYNIVDQNGDVVIQATEDENEFYGYKYLNGATGALNNGTITGTNGAILTFNNNTKTLTDTTTNRDIEPGKLYSITGAGAATTVSNTDFTETLDFATLVVANGVDKDGNTATADTLPLSLRNSGSDESTRITIDYSTVTNYGSASSLDFTRGDLGGYGAGKAAGTLSAIAISDDGKIVGNYTNGDIINLGQIAVTTFANAAGLEKIGDNLFQATMNSGSFNGIGIDITTNGDSITTGVLEMSNVDLAFEFTEMITTQRGFQANSRIITTSDTMLEELINLKR